MMRLEQPLVASLLTQAESGMGYQLVDVERTDGARMRGIAYNAELVLFEDEPRTQLRLHAHESLVKAAQASRDVIESVRVRQEPTRPISAVLEKPAERKAPPEAKDAPVGSTEMEDVFKRFSAYAKDRRVRPDGCLLPGTYATTEADARNVRTGSEAVQRYALPNPAPASYVLTSQPDSKTPIQRGVVAAANGQPGGGVEVIFPNGTQANTTTGPATIPD